MRRLLIEIATELHRRKDHVLARRCVAEAGGYPEADELPPAPVEPPDDHDAELKTSNLAGDLGVPPYDTRRPGVKSDEGKD